MKRFIPAWVMWVICQLKGGHSFGRWWWKDREEAHQLCTDCVDMRTPKNRRSWLHRERVGNNDKSTFAFVNIDKSGASHTFSFGQTRYGMGQEPAGGHKPITIIEVEDGAVPCDTRCDRSLGKGACDSCMSKH